MPKRILAIDYGTKRTGLAVGDEETRLASPFGAIATTGRAGLVEAIAKVIEGEEIGQVVVGLPLNMDGTAGPMVEAAMALAEALRQRTGVPVELFDERLTSHAAEGLFVGTEFTKKQRKRRVDSLAAMILLQSYLDRRG
jgi:putative Holliday junction resolvase